LLLVPVLGAMRGGFPLNGTYFQSSNEVFIDQRTLMQPLVLPQELLQLLQLQLDGCGTTSIKQLAETAPQQQQQQDEDAKDGRRQQEQASPNEETADAAAAAVATAADDKGTAAGADVVAEAPAAALPVVLWRDVYLGSSVASICSGMTQQQLQAFFSPRGCMCIRSYDPLTGGASLKLPAYLAPAAAGGVD
jgi:hypothetical protein